MHVLFYTLVEDGHIFPRRLWIKHRWTQASCVHDTAFGGQFNLIKLDHKFGYTHLVWGKKPGQRQYTEHSVAISLHYGRKKNVNSQYNTRHKVKWRTIEIMLMRRPFAKQIGILLTHVWLIIMVRNSYVYFILYYTWRWIQISKKLLN